MSTSKHRRRALWVLAHPDRDSLNARLRDTGQAALREGGWQVMETDLYAAGWNPVLVAEGGADVATEQDKLRAAELLVLQFPLWWYGPPAILKGWIDRVFQAGFAYDVIDPDTGRARKYGDGGLAGRRALTLVTAGDRPGSLQPRGISGSIEDVLWPLLHGTFWYTGMWPLSPHLIAGRETSPRSAWPASSRTSSADSTESSKRSPSITCPSARSTTTTPSACCHTWRGVELGTPPTGNAQEPDRTSQPVGRPAAPPVT